MILPFNTFGCLASSITPSKPSFESRATSAAFAFFLAFRSSASTPSQSSSIGSGTSVGSRDFADLVDFLEGIFGGFLEGLGVLGRFEGPEDCSISSSKGTVGFRNLLDQR